MCQRVITWSACAEVFIAISKAGRPSAARVDVVVGWEWMLARPFPNGVHQAIYSLGGVF